MCKYLLFISFFLVHGFTNALCQHQESIEKKSIEKIAQYRDKLIEQKQESIIELNGLVYRWYSLEPSLERINWLTMNLMILSKIEQYDFKKVKNRAKLHESNSLIVNNLTENDIEIISKNYELLDLINAGVLKIRSPFIIDPETNFIKELKIYDIEAGDAIAEIGVGSGVFSLLISMIYPDVELNVNEIDKSYLDYFSGKLDDNKELVQSNKIAIIQGDKKSTGFEDVTLDKIIIRNAFHHFSRKKKMLKSIKKSMADSSYLYIIDPVNDLANGQSICHKALDQSQLIRVVEKSGFEVVEEYILGKEILLKLRLGN